MMELNNILLVIAMSAFFSTGRAIYVLMGVFHGVKTLSEFTDYQQVLKSPKAEKLKKQIVELFIHLFIISGICFAMFLFATSGSM